MPSKSHREDASSTSEPPPTSAASPASAASKSPPTPPASASGEAAGDGQERYRRRDTKLLWCLRVYRLVIYRVFSLLFFGGPGKSCGHVVKRLSDAGLVEIHKRGFPGGVTWVCLTAKGARETGLRNRPDVSGSSIATYTQTLLFCTNSDSGIRRHLLETSEVNEVSPKGVFASNVHVVLTEEFGEPAILRCFHARGSVKSVVKALQSLVEGLAAKPGMARAMQLGQVGIAVLCPTQAVRNAVRREVKPSSLPCKHIVIEWAPDSGHLAEYLKQQKARDEQV